MASTSTPDFTRPLVLFGPSGTGKSTLLKKLLAEFPDKFGFSVSHTTRSPRTGESPGVAYHFTDRPTFERLISEGAFIENAEFSGNRYGTSAKAVQDFEGTGRRCILDIDMQGVHQIRTNHPHLNPIYLFISPPSFASLRTRLTSRGTESPESLQARLDAAKGELEYAVSEQGKADVVVVNDDLERAYGLFKRVALGEVMGEGEGDSVPGDL
ncbi:guanylate kinase [Mrakia frigida]|uniref:guanylate kinase n=1 Tax=Mrakia frigida TaxID=29902 RepID=UPI003FCBF436